MVQTTQPVDLNLRREAQRPLQQQERRVYVNSVYDDGGAAAEVKVRCFPLSSLGLEPHVNSRSCSVCLRAHLYVFFNDMPPPHRLSVRPGAVRLTAGVPLSVRPGAARQERGNAIHFLAPLKLQSHAKQLQ